MLVDDTAGAMASSNGCGVSCRRCRGRGGGWVSDACPKTLAGAARRAYDRLRRMRASIKVAAVAAGLVSLAAPTNAADQTVHAVAAGVGDYGSFDNHFEPATVRVAPGEAVTWVNDGGTHNVRFEDGRFEAPADPAPPEAWPAPVRRSFNEPGAYRFYCEAHGGPGGVGMSGIVLVGSQTAAPPPGAPGSGSPTGSPRAGAAIRSLSAVGRRFCSRRGPRCRRPGVRLLINLSRAARVRGTLKRRALDRPGRARRYGTLDFGTVGEGRRVLRFARTRSGRRLARGRYSLTIRVEGESRVLRFSVFA